MACQKDIVSVAELLLFVEQLKNKKLPSSSAMATQTGIKTDVPAYWHPTCGAVWNCPQSAGKRVQQNQHKAVLVGY